jgi:SAM-dependent methyltransferase
MTHGYARYAIDDAHLYNQDYFDGYYLKDPKRDAMYLQERNRILKYYPQGGRVLDVGCGVGGFLNTFDDRWEKWGIEPSEFAFEKAAKKGIQMLQGLRMADFEGYDVVVFRGTLQHINFPMADLVQATRALKRNGLLVILATPDTDSLVYNVFGNLPALDAPRNWIVFGHRVLTNILKRLEYTEVTVLHPYWQTPYASPLKDFGKFFVSLLFGWRKFAFPGNMMEIYAVKK